MKRVIAIIMLIVIVLSGCAKIVQKVPIDSRIIPEHTETRVWFSTQRVGESTIIIPHHHTVNVPTDYQLCFRLVYDNDKMRTRWESVGKDEYDAYIEGI